MNPQLPSAFVNKWANGTPTKPPAQFPPNLAAMLPIETQRQILLWVSSKYLWPQIQERVPFEKMWEVTTQMARVTLDNENLFANTQTKDSSAKAKADESNRDKAICSDTVVHDAIERLTNITQFIAFKDDVPVKFVLPDYQKQPMATKVYNPNQRIVDAGNALLRWNSSSATNLLRNSQVAYRSHYTYGISFVISDYEMRIENIARRGRDGKLIPVPELTKIGTTFDPISINKVWLNWRLPANEMEAQPCPFYFTETPRFAVLQNQYDPALNPFGYVNTDKIVQDQWLYTGQEMQATQNAFATTFASFSQGAKSNQGLAQILEPKHSVEARWTIYPMLPLDPTTGEFDHDGSKKIPYTRFVMESFGPNITSGAQVLLRLQQNYYPKGRLPLYASVHMPDTESGAYAPSVGQLLFNHYREIVRCKEQFFDNKDWINDPPSWVQSSSPALDMNLTKKGSKIPVNSPNDFGWRVPYDATNSTLVLLKMLRDEAQTTSKAVDAILGKAMGSRTSATEANNVYQAAMSGVTADIDSITAELHGNYAQRVWDYAGLWMDADLLKAITGQFGFEIDPSEMWINLHMQTNCGSQFISNSIRQQNLRYILESSKMEQGLDRAALWTELLDDMGFDANRIVNDNFGQDVELATMQACATYLGEPVIISPDQNHQVSIAVKTRFLEDRESIWNQKYGQQTPLLVQQIQQHQQFMELQLMQMQLQQQGQMLQQKAMSSQTSTAPPTETGGQVAQQQGGTLA